MKTNPIAATLSIALCFVDVIKSEISQLDTVCVTCVTQKPCATCVSQDEWGPWGPWSDCTFKYGLYSQTRQRVCTSGPGKCTGGNGGGEEAIRCSPPATTTLQPLPQWSQWGPWGQCSASCGGGVQVRTRVCSTQCGTCKCQGAASEQQPCNTQTCCNWNAWSEWSECSVTCGSGFELRTRTCTCNQCAEGEGIEQRACEMSSCVTCDTCAPVTTPPPCGINNPCPTLQPCNNCQNPPTIPTIPVVKTVERSSSSSNTNFIPVIGSSQNTNIINSEYNTMPIIH